MTSGDILTIAVLCFISGGFFGAALQLWEITRDLNRIIKLLQKGPRND